MTCLLVVKMPLAVITAGDEWNTVWPRALPCAGTSHECVGTHPADLCFYDKVTLSSHSVRIAPNIWLKRSSAEETGGGRDGPGSANFYSCQCSVLGAAAPSQACRRNAQNAHFCCLQAAAVKNQNINLEDCAAGLGFTCTCVKSQQRQEERGKSARVLDACCRPVQGRKAADNMRRVRQLADRQDLYME